MESGRKEYFYTFSAESVIEKLSVEMGSSNSGKITKMSFRSVDSLYSNAKFAVITVLFVFLLIYIGISLAFVGKFSFLIMTVCAVLISIPYIYLQLRFSMDMYFHIARVFSFSKSLSIGQFPWRIATDYLFGTGNVVADMYPNIFLFPFAFMCKKRVSFTVIWKIMMLMINILTAYMGYIGIRLVVKDKRICLVFSILLLLAPYRLMNEYVRGDVGELISMAFMPLAAGGIWLILFGNNRRKKTGVLACVLGMTAIMQSHILSTELFVFLLL